MRLQMSRDELSRLLAVELEIQHDVAYQLAVSMLPGSESLPDAWAKQWAEQRKLPPAILRRRYNWDLDRIDDRSCDREESEQRALAAVREVAAYEQGAFLAPFFVEARPVFRMRHFVHGLARVIELDPIGSEARMAAVKVMRAVCQHAIDWPEEAVLDRPQPTDAVETMSDLVMKNVWR